MAYKLASKCKSSIRCKYHSHLLISTPEVTPVASYSGQRTQDTCKGLGAPGPIICFVDVKKSKHKPCNLDRWHTPAAGDWDSRVWVFQRSDNREPQRPHTGSTTLNRKLKITLTFTEILQNLWPRDIFDNVMADWTREEVQQAVSWFVSWVIEGVELCLANAKMECILRQ